MKLSFLIPGEPSHAARARAAVIAGHARIYTPEKNRASGKVIRDYAFEAMEGRSPVEGPIRLEVTATYMWPKSWSRPARERSLGFKTSRPDLDNIIKLAKDSLNGIVWRDDSQVVIETITKRYGESPSTSVTVELLR